MALFSVGGSSALLAVASLACPTFALADGTSSGSPDLHSEFSRLPYAHLVLETRNISIAFPDTRAEDQKSIRFAIIGNIPVKVHAEPDSRIRIGGRSLGRATSGSEAVGYDVAVKLDRKRGSKLSSMIEPKSVAKSSSGNSTSMEDAVLSTTGHGKTNWMWDKIYGELTVKTNASWSAGGGLPLVGNYVGQVTITLTPDF